MDISTFLDAGATRVIGTVSSKKRLFQELSEQFADIYGLNAAQVTESLLERESLGPTGVGHGVALPHARLPGLETMRAVFLRLEKPIEFEAADRVPVDLVFSIMAPEDSGVEHLKALALISRTMRDSAVCAKLRANENPATLHAILTEKRSAHAA